MQTYIAERSEILRASQKDEEYLNVFQQQISDLIKRIGGDANWIRLYLYIEPLARLLYYGATSLKGMQTLGEEYLCLIQVSDQHDLKLASVWQRALWVVMESWGPLAVDRQLKKWKQSDELYYQRQTSNSRIPLVRVIASTLLRHLTVGIIERLHLAFFYLFASKFYSIWKRISGIKYVTIRPQTDSRMSLIFKIIGASFLFQFLLSLFLAVRRDVSKMAAQKNEEVQESTPGSQKRGDFVCDICLNSEDPITTPCGHIYCFDCVLFHSEHVDLDASLGQCPNCRFQFELRTIVPLLNF